MEKRIRQPKAEDRSADEDACTMCVVSDETLTQLTDEPAESEPVEEEA